MTEGVQWDFTVLAVAYRSQVVPDMWIVDTPGGQPRAETTRDLWHVRRELQEQLGGTWQWRPGTWYLLAQAVPPQETGGPTKEAP